MVREQQPWLDVPFGEKDDAKAARKEFGRALASYIDLVALERNSGSGPRQAMEIAANIGDSWVFRRLAEELSAGGFVFAGDDLGDVEAFEAAVTAALAAAARTPATAWASAWAILASAAAVRRFTKSARRSCTCVASAEDGRKVDWSLVATSSTLPK